MPGAPAIFWHSGAVPTSFPSLSNYTATLTITQAIPANADVFIIPVIDFGGTSLPESGFSVTDITGQIYTEYTAFTVTDNTAMTEPTPGSHILWYKLNHPGMAIGGTISVSGYAAASFHIYVLNGVNTTTPVASAAKARWEATAISSGLSSGNTAAVSQTNVLLIGGICENVEQTVNTFPNLMPGMFSANEISSPWTLAELAQYSALWQADPSDYYYLGTRQISGYRSLTNASGAYSFAVSSGVTAETNVGTVHKAYNEIYCFVINGEANIVPNAPTLAPRSNFDATQAATFNWIFSDPNTVDNQTAYQLQILTNPGAVLTYDSGKITSTASTCVVPANSLAVGINYQWKVRTYDLSDTVGAYSSLSSFSTIPPPTIAITAPSSDGATVFTTTPTISWTFTGSSGTTQATYDVVIVGPSGTVYDSGIVTSTATSQVTGTLPSGVTYTASLTVTDSVGNTTTVSRIFFVSAPSPAPPLVSAAPSADGAGITLTITARS